MDSLDPDLLLVRIPHFGRSSLWPWWRFTARTRSWVLWHDDRDGASCVVAGKRWPLRPDRVLLLPPDLPISTVPAPGVHQLYLHVELVGLSQESARRLADGPVDLGPDPLLIAQAQALHGMLGDLRSGAPAGETQPIAALAARAFAYQALSRLLTIAPLTIRHAIGTQLSGNGAVAPALRHIELNLGNPLYVSALARLCGMGPQWFTRLMRDTTGMTPAQYIMERRAQSAARQLIFTTDPIDLIAERTGFTDRAHFTRIFTRLRKTSPARYRDEERRRLGRHPDQS